MIQKWTALKELVYLLKIPYDATIEFQRHKLALSDVYGKWIGMQLHLKMCATKKQFKSGLAKHFDSFESRKKNIFKNPFMAAALYLDPRYHHIVVSNDEKRENARETLLKIYRRIHAIESTTNNDSTAEKTNVSSDFSFEFDEKRAVLEHFSQRNTGAHNTSVSSTTDIEMIINLFCLHSFPPNCSNILEYWADAKDTHRELYDLAMVVFAIPPTEVQIERDFSHLKCVFTDRRCNLNQSRLEAILLIHLNKDLFYKVNENAIRNCAH